MDSLSLFDVLGPVMIGPSSSHTAGATRIGWLTRQLVGAPVKIILRFEPGLMHTYKGHGTDAGLVAGLLGRREDDPRIRTSIAEAKAAGLGPTVEALPADGPRNRMECEVVLADGTRRRVLGISVGGGNIKIVEIDDFELEMDGQGGGVLIAYGGRQVPAGLLAALEARGFWPAAARLGKLAARADAAAAGSDRGLVFVPGPEDPGPEYLAGLSGALAGQGVRSARWVPGLRELRSDPARRIPAFTSGQEFVSLARAIHLEASGEASAGLPAAAIRYEEGLTGLSPDEVHAEAARVLGVMRESAETGLRGGLRLMAGFVPGDDGQRVWRHAQGGHHLAGEGFARAIARSLAVAEVNASMGRVVAAPTAGSCGVLPGTLLTVGERVGASDARLRAALLVAAAVGAIIGRTASFSGSVGGCQGEVGIAAAMSAAAATHLAGGDEDAVLHAAAIALKNLIGLACDPAAGPVEVPCIKRNAGGVSIALSAAEIALAGVRSAIPFDETILALKNAQDLLHEDLRDNTLGGLGSTPTAALLKAKWECNCR